MTQPRLWIFDPWVPVDPHDFEYVPRSEAVALKRRFLKELPRLPELMPELLGRLGPTDGIVFDCSDASMSRLLPWVKKHIKLRECPKRARQTYSHFHPEIAKALREMDERELGPCYWLTPLSSRVAYGFSP